MAGAHTFKQMGRDVTIFAIDHSVGAGGANRMDDVQLIQILINRYIVYKAASYKEYGSDTRVVDRSGGQLKQLKVDGLCGPVTLAAILAAQRSMNRWKGVTVDGRIDPIKEGGASQYEDGTVAYESRTTRIMGSRFNSMYLLGATATFEPNPPWNLFSLPDPLKSSLMRSTIGKSIQFLTSLGQGESMTR